jgi:hypothetical protein
MTCQRMLVWIIGSLTLLLGSAAAQMPMAEPGGDGKIRILTPQDGCVLNSSMVRTLDDDKEVKALRKQLADAMDQGRSEDARAVHQKITKTLEDKRNGLIDHGMAKVLKDHEQHVKDGGHDFCGDLPDIPVLAHDNKGAH